MGTSHTTNEEVEVQRYIRRPLKADGERNTNGDLVVGFPGNCYVSKIQCNGNMLYSASPTTQITLLYAETGFERPLYGPLYIKTINPSIGVTLHMRTLLGNDLWINAERNGRIIARITQANTRVRLDVWGYEYIYQ